MPITAYDRYNLPQAETSMEAYENVLTMLSQMKAECRGYDSKSGSYAKRMLLAFEQVGDNVESLLDNDLDAAY